MEVRTMIEKPTVFNYEDHLAALEDLRRADITCTYCSHRTDCSNGGSLDCCDCDDTGCHCHDCHDNDKWEWRAGMDDRYDGLRYAIELGRLEEQKKVFGMPLQGSITVPNRLLYPEFERKLLGRCIFREEQSEEPVKGENGKAD